MKLRAFFVILDTENIVLDTENIVLDTENIVRAKKLNTK